MTVEQSKDIILRHSMLFSSMPDDVLEALHTLLEQEPCEDEYIKVPKKALKYRTAGMVAYNAEWLKNNFDIERAVICGVQETETEKVVKMRNATPEERESVDNYIKGISKPTGVNFWDLEQEPKMGHWIRMKTYEKWGCSECNTVFRFTFKEHNYCPNCGAKMESEEV